MGQTNVKYTRLVNEEDESALDRGSRKGKTALDLSRVSRKSKSLKIKTALGKLGNINTDTFHIMLLIFMKITIALTLYQCWIIITTYNKIKNNPEEYRNNLISDRVYLMTSFMAGFYIICAVLAIYMFLKKYVLSKPRQFPKGMNLIFMIVSGLSISFGILCLTDTVGKDKLSDITKISYANVAIGIIMFIVSLVIVIERLIRRLKQRQGKYTFVELADIISGDGFEDFEQDFSGFDLNPSFVFEQDSSESEK